MIEFWIANGAALILIAAASVQLVIARRFRQAFVSSDAGLNGEQPDGHVAVLLSVRGADPSIGDCIVGVLNQTYEDFELNIVIDHASDPAVEIIAGVQEQHENGHRINVSILDVNADKCSLKCLSLSQAATLLTDDVKYVALVDADVSPHETWLENLLRPLSDESVGGVTGTQWFEPPANAGFGTWLRSVWNGGAAILTMYFANPWAGSFAMRRADLIESKLIERWQRSMVDDGPIRSALHSIGKRVVFARPLVMVNQEECSLEYTLRWAVRMLTWSRLHEPTFWVTILHAAFSNFVMLANFLVLFLAVLGILHPGGIVIAMFGLVVAGCLCSAAYAEARKCVNHSLAGRLAPSLPTHGKHAVWSFVCAAPAHLMFGWGCLRAIFKCRIVWRGIEYSIASGGVKRLSYSPFSSEDERAGHSI